MPKKKIAIIAGSVIERDNKYLLVQERKKRVYGLWNLPAGHVEEGDTIEQTAIKETKEETGYDVILIKKIAVFREKVSNNQLNAFQAKITSGRLKFPKDELLDARWFTLDEIKKMKNILRGHWVLGAISKVAKMV